MSAAWITKVSCRSWNVESQFPDVTNAVCLALRAFSATSNNDDAHVFHLEIIESEFPFLLHAFPLAPSTTRISSLDVVWSACPSISQLAVRIIAKMPARIGSASAGQASTTSAKPESIGTSRAPRAPDSAPLATRTVVSAAISWGSSNPAPATQRKADPNGSAFSFVARVCCHKLPTHGSCMRYKTTPC